MRPKKTPAETVSDGNALQRACDRLGVAVPPAAMGDDASAFVVSAVSADDNLTRDGKCRILAAYFACRCDEPVAWDDTEAWCHASGWYDKAAAVLDLVGT